MLIVACGDKPESTQAESAPPAPAATAEAPAPAPETMPIEKVVESVVDETVAEADEQVQAEEELVLAQAAETQPKPAVAQKYSEGQHYSVL
ncbi:MAG: hypothetical protein KJO13_11500, partial [Gammaproteobacteria bacterium]|nr:hypothetical protein [Gammaproteobacteria bacterium]